MTFKEVNNFMERIKSYYQEFTIDDFKTKEWYSQLKQYDSEDVNKKFDEHLKSEIYGDNIPKLNFLTRYLIPSAQKGVIHHNTVMCQLCEQAVFDDDYEKHYIRCSSSTTICRDMKKYFNKKIDYQKLMELEPENFENVYQAYLNKMLEAPIPDFWRKVILRCIYPDMNVDINELVKEMANGGE